MSQESRWQLRFQSFSRAQATFARILATTEEQQADEIPQMALIQAFEFTYELAWKMLKDYLESEGLLQVATPKEVIRTAFQAGVLNDGEKWMEAIAKRNLASHAYSQEVLNETVDYIRNEFAPLAQQLHQEFEARLE